MLGLVDYDDRLSTNEKRVKNREKVRTILEQVTSGKKTSDWIEIFDKVTGRYKFAFSPANERGVCRSPSDRKEYKWWLNVSMRLLVRSSWRECQ